MTWFGFLREAPKSIFDRLRLLLTVLFLIGVVAALSAAWLFSTAAATEAYDRLLLSAAVQLAESIQADEEGLSVSPPDSVFETLALSDGDRFFYAVRDPAGRLMTGRGDLPFSRRPERWQVAHLEYARYRGAKVRVVALDHFVVLARGHGWSRVVVAETLDARRSMVLHLMERIGAIILLVSFLGFTASIEAARRAIRPLGRIGDAVARREPHDLTPLGVDGPRETAGLVGAIDDLMARLSGHMAKLESFAAVAAHQIRTPLTAISAQTELLAHDRTASTRRQRVERLRSNVAQLSRVTNQLLGQAMVSYRSGTVQHHSVNLLDLLRSVANETVPMSLERDLSIEMPTCGAIVTQGDAISLREAFANLIDNAVVHGAPSTVRISLQKIRGEIEVTIADDGPGVPPALWQVAHIPFQVPRTERNGAGLGISIVSEIARAHDGALSFGFASDGFFEARIRLPLKGNSGITA